MDCTVLSVMRRGLADRGEDGLRVGAALVPEVRHDCPLEVAERRGALGIGHSWSVRAPKTDLSIGLWLSACGPRPLAAHERRHRAPRSPPRCAATTHLHERGNVPEVEAAALAGVATHFTVRGDVAVVVVGKCYLQGASRAEVASLLAEHQTIMSAALLHELLTGDERERARCFYVLPPRDNPLLVVEDPGPLIRYEASNRRSCTPLTDRCLKGAFQFNPPPQWERVRDLR